MDLPLHNSTTSALDCYEATAKELRLERISLERDVAEFSARRDMHHRNHHHHHHHHHPPAYRNITHLIQSVQEANGAVSVVGMLTAALSSEDRMGRSLRTEVGMTLCGYEGRARGVVATLLEQPDPKVRGQYREWVQQCEEDAVVGTEGQAGQSAEGLRTVLEAISEERKALRVEQQMALRSLLRLRQLLPKVSGADSV